MLRRATAAGVLAAALAAAPSGAAPALVPPPSATGAWTARIVASTTARRAPWDARAVSRLATAARWGGGPNQLLVLDSVALGRRVWLKVQLPIRPNGSSGWIPASRARLRMTRWRIRVSVGERAVRVYRSRRLVRRFRAVVGAPSTPTPHGEFAVSERIAQPDPHGFLGPWALHLTAFSDVLEDFGGGPGRIGLHGRDGAALSDPLGSARSHGCIRVDNAAVRFLARVAVPGTPVHIGR